MAIIYQKPGADKCCILSPRERMRRGMSIPAGWAALKLALAYSATDASGPNAIPVAEELVWNSSLDDLYFGVGNDITPGTAGSKFIGVGNASAGAANSMAFSGGEWKIGSGGALATGHVVSSGVTATRLGSFPFVIGADPTASVGHLSWKLLKIVRSAGTVTIGQASVTGASDPSDEALFNLLTSTAFLSLTTTSAFSDVAAWDVRKFYFRSPLRNNRIRVHNYGFLLES